MDISANDYNRYAAEAKEWAADNLGGDFKFRDCQIDCIVNIVNNVMKSVKTHVCEAPTGTGKSLIAFISAGVLAKYHNKSTYILCSDTALFKQYENDIARYNLSFGCVCGKDNYYCQKNGQSFSNGSCQQKGFSIKKVAVGDISERGDFALCSQSCKYLNALVKGHRSPVTVLTYQLWFCANSEEEDDEGVFNFSWKKRDLVICDEAHKLPDIVQSIYSPRINLKENAYLDNLIKYSKMLTSEALPERSDFEEVFRIMTLTMNKSNDSEAARSQNMIYCLNKYYKLLGAFYNVTSKYTESVRKSKQDYKVDQTKYLKAIVLYKQDYMIFTEYLNLIRELGTVWSVPSIINKDTIVYNCAQESKMVKAFFHNKTNCEFLMSATIGNLDNFRTMISSDDDKSFSASEADNGFDFSRSPIYYNDAYHKLSYREKTQNLPLVMRQIEKICSSYKGTHGIIQTGSYEFSKYVFDNASPSLKSRLISYNNASERKQAINNFESFHGKILIGPSLIEGLDFADDLCRFIIIMKLPYASLADRLVKAKMAVYPNWYTNDVVNKIIQGLGILWECGCQTRYGTGTVLVAGGAA